MSRVIMAWGAKSSVTTRRSIRSARSMIGMTKITPGPRNGVSRPRRKTTARSFSLSTLRPLSKIATPTTIIIPSAGPIGTSPAFVIRAPPPAALHSVEKAALRFSAHLDLQPAHRDHTHPRPNAQRLVAHRAPMLAVHEHAPGRARRDRLAHLADFADHALAPGGGGPMPPAQK